MLSLQVLPQTMFLCIEAKFPDPPRCDATVFARLERVTQNQANRIQDFEVGGKSILDLLLNGLRS